MWLGCRNKIVDDAIGQHVGGMDFASYELVELHLSDLIAETADEETRGVRHIGFGECRSTIKLARSR